MVERIIPSSGADSTWLRRMFRTPALALLAAGLAFGGCASGPHVDPQVSSAMQSRGVSANTLAKVNAGGALTYEDIRNLVEKSVPSHTIISYLQGTRKVYDFSQAQLQGLKAVGATPQLLNYLTETRGFYGNTSPQQRARMTKEQGDRYYRSPLYQDEAPFAYNPPVIDDWYDSAYEESLYSPFSFN